MSSTRLRRWVANRSDPPNAAPIDTEAEDDKEALKEDGSGECLLLDAALNGWCHHQPAENAFTASSAHISMCSSHFRGVGATAALWKGGELCRPSCVGFCETVA